jgi:hypothetical protein
MLAGKAEGYQQCVEVVGDAGDRGGIQRPPLDDEPLGAPAGLGDGGLTVVFDLKIAQ